MKYLLFHPNPSLRGEILDETIAENIVAAARRGKMTKSAKGVVLVPDKRGTYRDGKNISFRGYGRVKRSECLPLKSLKIG